MHHHPGGLAGWPALTRGRPCLPHNALISHLHARHFAAVSTFALPHSHTVLPPLRLQTRGPAPPQVDDPALREGLPLKRERWASYLSWAVDAFRLCTGVAAAGTQVVTHLCYSDFQDILPAIDRMDGEWELLCVLCSQLLSVPGT